VPAYLFLFCYNFPRKLQQSGENSRQEEGSAQFYCQLGGHTGKSRVYCWATFEIRGREGE